MALKTEYDVLEKYFLTRELKAKYGWKTQHQASLKWKVENCMFLSKGRVVRYGKAKCKLPTTKNWYHRQIAVHIMQIIYI